MVKGIAPLLRSLDTRTTTPVAKVADAFYLSPEWRKLVDQIIAKRGRICEDPHCDGHTHRSGMRVFADHIIERKDGGEPLDEGNIMLRCGASHSRKTAAERARRMAARG